jgi:hypothetical protein
MISRLFISWGNLSLVNVHRKLDWLNSESCTSCRLIVEGAVGPGVGVFVGVSVGLGVGVLVGIGLGVLVGVGFEVGVGVNVGIEELVAVGERLTNANFASAV